MASLNYLHHGMGAKADGKVILALTIVIGLFIFFSLGCAGLVICASILSSRISNGQTD